MKSIKIVVIAIILVFLAVISLSRIQNKDISLKNESEINILAKKVEYYKGVITIEDSISISGNCPIIKPDGHKHLSTLADFSGPYRFIKESNNDTIKIVISTDTLFFKFISMD